jgi:hypothetical protein
MIFHTSNLASRFSRFRSFSSRSRYLTVTVMRKEFSLIDWSPLHDLGVDKGWNKIKLEIENSMTSNTPQGRKKKNTRLKPSWMKSKLLRVIKKKYLLYKRILRTKTGINYQRYILTRNRCKKMIKKAKKEHEKNVAINCKENPKAFGKYVQSKIKVNTGISPLNMINGKKATTDEEKADTLNKFFASVFTQEKLDNLPKLDPRSRSNGITLTDIRVSPVAVEQKLKNLNKRKAQWPDSIPSKVLKELSKELALPLTILFNKSLEDGKLPEDWKNAEVIAIF